jgi:DNA-binding response OmpR family regulator
VLRRVSRVAEAPAAPAVRVFGSLAIDPLAREVVLGGDTLELTRIEFDLLDTLSASPRVAFSRAQLLERVWGENWFGDDHLVDVHISNLRRKLADDPRSPDFVCTVRGVGYRMGAGR